MKDTETPDSQPKTTAELFADRYFRHFAEVRSGGLFGPGFGRNVPDPSPDREAE